LLFPEEDGQQRVVLDHLEGHLGGYTHVEGQLAAALVETKLFDRRLKRGKGDTRRD
jgi:hypothetical protein